MDRLDCPRRRQYPLSAQFLHRALLQHGGYPMSTAAQLVHVLALILLLCVTAPVVVASESKEISDFDRFQLWNRCRPLAIRAHLSGEATNIELTEDMVEETIKAKLQLARLYSSDLDTWDGSPIKLSAFKRRLEIIAGLHPHLVIEIQVFDPAFFAEAKFVKPVTDELSEVKSGATTWVGGTIGTHGGQSDFILSSISRTVDTFILEYLRVNDLAC